MKQTRINWENKTPNERQGPWWGLACCESQGKQNEKDWKCHAPNKTRERWNNKEEINKGPATDNGIRASSLEVRTGFFSRLVTLWLLAILQRLPRVTCAHMCTWISASWRRFRYDRKCLFSCIYNPQITISATSLFSANFNENRVKTHPKPWTCSSNNLQINYRNFISDICN